MKVKNLIGFFFILLLSISLIVYADTLPDTVTPGAPFPQSWDSISIISNFTKTNVTPYSLNKTRGYIYEVDILVDHQTHRWIGYVGNITGNIILGDSSGNNLYQWDMNISSGEIYATRFSGGGAGTDADDGAQHDSSVAPSSDYQWVDWTNISCANRSVIGAESSRLNHNYNIDNDALNRTFDNDASFQANAMDFHVAGMFIDIDSDDCHGTFLRNVTGDTNMDFWQMVVLDDGTVDGVEGDIIYAAIIEDDKIGFNGNEYDFQMILPQNGNVLINDNVDNVPETSIAYYFYIEVVGEGWPGNPNP